jgi:mono/diheme cytochrome c family protein
MAVMVKRQMTGLVAAVVLMGVTACGNAAQDGASADGAGGAGGAPRQQVGADVALPEGITLEMVQAGQRVFQTTTCFTCHAMDGRGTPLGPNLRNGEWLNSDGSVEGIEAVVRTGVARPVRYPAPMPAMGGARLTDEQIRQLAAYVYAIGHGG